MKKVLLALMFAAAMFVGCAKQEEATVPQEPAVAPAVETSTAAPAATEAPAAPATK